MLKKTVTYEDPFNPGVEITEDLYFNLTKAELVEMEMGVEGGLKEHLEKVARAENGQQIMNEMKGIIFKAYGKRTPTGAFIKNDQVREEFESSEAYSTMFMEMVTNADAAVEFVGGIMPKGMTNENQPELSLEDRFAERLGTKAVDRPNLTKVEDQYPDGVELRSEPKKLTRAEMVAMNPEELKSGLAEGKYIL